MNPEEVGERNSTKGRIAAAELHATSIAADESNTAMGSKVEIGGDDGHERQSDERQGSIHGNRVGSAQERPAAGWDDWFLRSRRVAPGVPDGPWVRGFSQGSFGRGGPRRDGRVRSASPAARIGEPGAGDVEATRAGDPRGAKWEFSLRENTRGAGLKDSGRSAGDSEIVTPWVADHK